MKKSTIVVYLIHFGRKLGNQDNPRGMAGHYIGSACDLAARLERHRVGNGSRLMHAVAQAGIPWVLARTWEEGSRELERKLKSRKQASAFCPICRGEQVLQSGGRVLGRRQPAISRPVQFYR